MVCMNSCYFLGAVPAVGGLYPTPLVFSAVEIVYWKCSVDGGGGLKGKVSQPLRCNESHSHTGLSIKTPAEPVAPPK